MKILLGKHQGKEIQEMTIEEVKEVFADLDGDRLDRSCAADEIKRRRDRGNDRRQASFRHRRR